MNQRIMKRVAWSLACGAWLLTAGASAQDEPPKPGIAEPVPPPNAQNPADPLAKVATLKSQDLEQVKGLALQWLAEHQADEAARTKAEEIWSAAQEPGAPGVLDRLARTFALVDDRARLLVELCSQPVRKGPLPLQDWLKNEETGGLERNNLRLFYGRWLSQERLYDELLEQLADLQPADVVEPATLLFHQAVGHHRLLNKEAGLKSVGLLLEDVVDCPRRYKALAGLMQADLQQLEDESLDHIARRMDDIRRHLELGRAGQKVRTEEDGVIASLDKLIEEMEKQQQQQQQQQSSSGNGGSQRSSSPMPDSRLARANGPGDTDRKNVGKTAGWGDLPPKQREEALQQIGKDFPAYYRDVIEQYFRKRASEGSER